MTGGESQIHRRWRRLTAAERRAHPLNRLRGGLLAVAGWIGAQCLLAAAILAVLVTDDGADPGGVALPFGWLYWGVVLTGPPLALALLLRRHPAMPRVYAGYIAAVILLEIAEELREPALLTEAGTDWEVLGPLLAATAVDLVVVRYLLLGTRPNIVFRGRQP
ncbi:hypothetical protein LNKW23_17160 [Paralimibaculum aggregatum]|uniref:Uncharacterized protein n=1 Tax=Paralimibaculum aggregatum TaxID=3036245 RepID=A0ABQ6LGS8_9RHOB|nr:hypothetical protein [Limibaculum sp. NKW23]GMG82503.1 hypothetical protein LNKW23_17160 [Limibaculum sp. NKW23]